MFSERLSNAWIHRAVLLEAAAAVASASVAVRVLPFKRVVGRLTPVRACKPRMSAEDARAIAEVRWAVDACARRVPWRAVCFQRGLAAHAMLRRRGIASTVHYGVAQIPDEGLKAHVWVTAGDRDVIGGREAAGYARLASFPAGN